MNLSKRLTAAALPAALLGIERLLLSHGFRAVMRSEMVDRHRFWRWERDRQWAIDRVEAMYRVHSPHDLSVNFRAQLRVDAEREYGMDAAVTHFLAGRLLMYEFPLFQWLRLRTPERLAERLVAETESALPWFDQFATPEKCMARLMSPERTGGRIGTPPHDRALAVLEALRQ
jgi:hypothetical protein